MAVRAIRGRGTMAGEKFAEVLASLAGEYWERQVVESPVWLGTSLGDRRYDDRLADITPEALERFRRDLEGIAARARAIPDPELGPADRVTRTALIEDAEGELAYLSCHLEEWTVDPLSGPQVWFFNVESFQPIRTVAEARAMVRRWRAMGGYLDDTVGNLRRGVTA